MPWPRRRRPEAPSIQQTVARTTIGRDLTMINQVSVTYQESPGREFRLTPFTAHPGTFPFVDEARAQPSRLLDAGLDVVAFAGRGKELAWLEAWRDRRDGSTVSAFLVHGEGGSGKTRLARRFAQLSALCGWAVWQATYEPAGAVPPIPEQLATRAQRGVLMVIDYAERWPTAQLESLLRQTLASRADRPVRVLLLARSAGPWWEVLAQRARVAGQAHQLPPLTHTVSRPLQFIAARDCFAEALQVADFQTIDVPDLSHIDYDLVLAVHMAALVAVDAQLHGQAVPDDPARLSTYLLNREREAWRSLPPEPNQAPRGNGTALGRTVYTAILTGRVSHAEGATLLRRVRLASTSEAANQLLADHRVLYPERQPGTVLEPLYPDRLAEDFLALSTPRADRTHSLADPWTTDVPTVLLTPDDPADPPPAWSRSAMAVLIQTARRWPHIATGQLFPLLRRYPQLAVAAGSAGLATLVELDGLDLDTLDAIEPRLPDSSDFELDVGIAALTQRLAERRLPVTTDPVARAQLLGRLAWRHSNAGLHEQSLARSEETVTAYRSLAAEAPDTHRPALAHALDRLSYELNLLRRPVEALAAAEEAVALFQLVDPNSPGYLQGLATTQLALGDQLLSVRRRTEATAALEDALHRHRALASADPSTPSPALAATLSSLSLSFTDAGRLTEALALAEEGVQLDRQLAATHANAHLRPLADALHNLAYILWRLDRRTPRLAAIREAVDLFRRLADANPRAYLPNLAAALSEQAEALSRCGQHSDAVTAIEEAVTLWRRLAEDDPQTYRRNHAAALDTLANRLSEVDRSDEALAAAERSVALMRPLADTDPGLFLVDLAMATSTLGRRLLEVGRAAEALVATRRAVELRRYLVESEGPRHRADLANDLRSLCRAQQQLDRHPDARAAAEEAVSLLRGLAPDNPGDRSELAEALRLLSGILAYDSDRAAEGLALAEEALAIRRELHHDDPVPHEVGLALELFALSQLLSPAGRDTEAFPMADEARAVAAARMAAAPDRNGLQVLVIVSMGYVWIRLEHRRELPEALAMVDEVVRLLRLPLAPDSPAGPFRLHTVLRDRALLLTALDRRDEAQETLRAVVSEELADQRFRRTLDPAGHPVRHARALFDMADTDEPRGAEALAVRVLTTEAGIWQREWARRLLLRRAKRENRAGRDRLPALPAGTAPPGITPTAAALLADIMAFEAVNEAKHGASDRLITARKLLALGDPRGSDILVAQALDARLKRFHRKEAAKALTKAGDPRGRPLLADLFAEEATDTTVSRIRREMALDKLTALDDPRADELKAVGTGVELTARPQLGWPATVRTGLPASILTGVGPDTVAALTKLPTEPRARRHGRLARCLAAVTLPLLPAFALLIGAAVAESGGSHPGLGNWIALCVSAYVLYNLFIYGIGGIVRFAARAFSLRVDTKDNLMGGYPLLIPVLAVLGYFLAHPLFGIPRAVGKFVWNILIWR